MSDEPLHLSDEARADLVTRLVRVEGQVRGVQRMLSEGRDCQDIVTQLAAIRAAVTSVSVALAERCAQESLCNNEQISSDDVGRLLALLRSTR
jgi:DNA-binding FrmR family transcriptional regulator